MAKNLKKSESRELHTTKILGLSHEGRGIGVHQQRKLFIDGALPEETVTYYIKKKQRRYFDAVLVDVLTPSPHRVLPPCSHFEICGGCALQHLNMDSQLEHKQHTFLEQLHHFGSVKPQNILTPLSTDTLGYRRKARIGVRFVIKKNKLIVGFREKKSQLLADLEQCLVLHPRIGQQLRSLNQLISHLSQYQHIAQVEVAMGDERVALIFRHLQPLPSEDKTKLVAFGEAHQFDIYLQPNSPLPLEKLYPANSSNRLDYTLIDEGLTYSFHPLDFTQVHLGMNQLMIKQALHHLDLSENDIVLDLFSGIGNFTLPIAKRAQRVIGVEGSQEMVDRAYENAKRNQIDNVDYYADNLMSPNPQAAWLKRPYTKILLDPPRAGAKEILPLLHSFMAKTIVYISCNPATLARDAGDLVHQYGYTLTSAGIMNMFPHTTHTESLAVFKKNE